jgi:hypothetical protein
MAWSGWDGSSVIEREESMLDLYQSCPCHSDRKLKFCCGKDVVAQLSKVIDMFEGGQRNKAIQTLERAIEQAGHRDCLAGIRIATYLEDDNLQAAAAFCEAYVQENGATSVGCTLRAMVAIHSEDILEAVDHVQSALETGEPISSILKESILGIGLGLGRLGFSAAARDHLALNITLTGDLQGVAAQSLENLRHSLTTYPPTKHDWPCVPIPEGRVWSEAAAQALHWAENGLWRKALSVLLPLAEEQATEPVLWKNVAILAGRLAKLEVAGMAWQRYSQCPGVTHDHAVEADLLHILYAEVDQFETYPEVRRIYRLADVEGFLEQAKQDPLLEVVSDESLAPDPKTGEEPPTALVIAEVNFWGTTADADADTAATHRLAFSVLDQSEDASGELVFVGIESPAVTRVIESIVSRYPQVDPQSLSQRVFSRPLRILVDCMPSRVAGLQPIEPNAQMANLKPWLLQRLPDYATGLLGGRTLREAARLPEMRVRVDAVLLLLECDLSSLLDIRPTLQQLRHELGLPELAAIEPKTVRLPDLSLQQFTRLNFAEMPTRMLAWATNLALSYSLVNALRGLIVEIERRLLTSADEIRQFIPLPQVYLMLAKIEGQVSQSCELLERGFQELPADSRAASDWLVGALEICVSRRIEANFRRYFSALGELSEADDYAAAAMIKICSLLGIPGPSIAELRGTTARRMEREAAEPSAATAVPSKLVLPNS